ALGPGQADGQHGLPIIAVPGEHHTVPRHRRGDDIARETGAFPEESARREVVTAHALRRANHHLHFALVLDHEWRGPGGLCVAGDLPALLAGSFVEGIKEGITFMIPADNERVAVNHW